MIDVHEKKLTDEEIQQRVVKKIGSRPEVRTQKQKPKENHFPINKREKERKERKTNKRIEEKQQLKPLKTEQQIKLSNRGYR